MGRTRVGINWNLLFVHHVLTLDRHLYFAACSSLRVQLKCDIARVPPSIFRVDRREHQIELYCFPTHVGLNGAAQCYLWTAGAQPPDGERSQCLRGDIYVAGHGEVALICGAAAIACDSDHWRKGCRRKGGGRNEQQEMVPS